MNGWWDDPALLADVRQLRELLQERLARPWRPGADTLAVFDTESYYHTRSVKDAPDAISHALVNWGSLGLYRAGVAFDALHLADLAAADISQYKVVVFFNTHRMSAEERRLVREKIAAGGRHLVFCYAPGYTDGSRNDDAFVREVTGLDLQRVDLAGKATVQATAALGEALEYSVSDTAISPLYAVRDRDALALGRFVGTDHVAIARKEMPRHTAWYVALPSWSSALFSRLIARTPAHRYSEQGDVVYADAGLVTLHTKQGGRRTVVLRGGKRVDLELPAGPATVLLDATTGERVF